MTPKSNKKPDAGRPGFSLFAMTALGVQAIEHHHKRVRFFSTVELGKALEQEKAQGKTRQIATRLSHCDLASSTRWATCRSAPQAVPCCSTS